MTRHGYWRPDESAATGSRFPATARRPGTQSGKLVRVLQRPERIPRLIGPRQPEPVLTESVDFRSADELYSEPCFFVIGERVIFRHLPIAPHRNLHTSDRRGASRWSAPNCAARRGRCKMARAEKLPREIRRRFGIDRFGADCALAPDRRFILYGANGTMTFFPFSDDPRHDYACGYDSPAVAAMTEVAETTTSVLMEC